MKLKTPPKLLALQNFQTSIGVTHSIAKFHMECREHIKVAIAVYQILSKSAKDYF